MHSENGSMHHPVPDEQQVLQYKILELQGTVAELESQLSRAKKAETDFRIFFEEASNGMVLFDRNLNIVDVNPAFVAITDIQTDQVLNKSIYVLIETFIPKAQRTKVVCIVNNMLQGNFIKPFEIEYESKTFEISFHTGSQLRQMIGIISDITARKQTERKLEESEFNLRSLFNGMTEIVFEIDFDGKYLNIAPTAPGLMYRPPNEAIGKTLHEMFPKEQADVFLGFIRRCFELKTPQTMEYPLIINGKKLWFEGRATMKTDKTVLFIAYEITKKKETEEALSLSEEKFSNFFEQSQEGVRLTNSKGVIIAWNKGMEEITGIPKKEAIGSNTWDITYRVTPDERKSPELYERIRRMVLESIESGTITWVNPSREYILQRTDGTIRFVHTSIFPVKTSSGLILGSILHDITSSKKNEASLKDERNLLQGLLDNLMLGVMVWSKDENLIMANEGFSKISGYAREEINTREDWLTRAYPDQSYRQMVMKDWKTSQSQPGTIREFKICCKDGVFKDIEFRTSFLQDGRAIVSLADISERTRNYEMLRRKDILLEATAEASQILLGDKPLNQTIVQALEIIGKATDRDRVYVFEFHSDPVNDVLYMSQRYEWVRDGISIQINNPDLQNIPVNEIAPRWYELLSQGLPVKGNVRDFPEMERQALEAQDIISVLAMPVVVNERCWGFVGFDNCISEDNWSEAESLILKSVSITIGMAIIRRRAEIELRKAKEKAEEYNNLKTSFLQNMSHEIRTPMNGILGFTELLNEPDLTGEMQQEYINIIKASGQRMLNIINDLMDVSLIESGQMEVNKNSFMLDEEILSLYRFFKPEAETKLLRLLLVNGTLNSQNNVFTDKDKFYAILSNLVKNAIKYTDKGFVEIGYQKNNSEYEFFVKDSGIGIPNDKMEIIFDRFVQADLTISKPYEGAGLGLSIAKAYVEMLGGRIWAESELGIGSQFYFTIPCADLQSGIWKEREMIHKIRPGAEAAINVLIAEDTESSDFYLTQILKKYSKAIFHVTTGAKAVNVCKNNPEIDLILMDIKMPEMDGYQAARQIRQFNQKVVIIAQTAYAVAGDREKSIQAGCNDHIAKPIKKEALLNLIAKYLSLG